MRHITNYSAFRLTFAGSLRGAPCSIQVRPCRAYERTSSAGNSSHVRRSVFGWRPKLNRPTTWLVTEWSGSNLSLAF